ncbi:MAG: hypothetical protein N3E49_05635 [Bacteroidia bacterium]|nr:hypothetical protein [Bacteroidia bacterium]
MRVWIFMFNLGLALWAQSSEGESRASLHYDAMRQVLILSADGVAPSERVEIVDLVGRRVRSVLLPADLTSSESWSISVADLPEGLYYVRWLTEQGRLRAIRRLSITR